MTPAVASKPSIVQIGDPQVHQRVVALAPGLTVRSQLITVARNAEVFSQEDACSSVYKVQSGVVRATRLLDDGRRHVLSFYFPGDVFGLEPGETRAFSAEAVTDCKIASVRRADVGEEMERCGYPAGKLWRVMANELERLQEHCFLLSRLSAVERVWAFLKMMGARSEERDMIDLPMSRTDIADHLGLTIETVSRAFTHLRQQGAIDIICARRVRLRHAASFPAAA